MLICVLDIESTCWNKHYSGPSLEDFVHPRMEIIEIGAVIMDEQFRQISTFSSMVKPVLNPRLSGFCKKLTHISQEEVDSAPDFEVAFSRFCAKVRAAREGLVISEDVILCAWGGYDRHQLALDCSMHGLAMPFLHYVDIKGVYKNRFGKKPGGLLASLEAIGKSFEGVPHRALTDAQNAATILREAFKDELKTSKE